jgi:hypothetical protein
MRFCANGIERPSTGVGPLEGPVPGPVALDLAVVPHRDDRVAGVHALQGLVGAVGAVAPAELPERLGVAVRAAVGLEALLADRGRVLLVDVVAERQHNVEVLVGGDPRLGGEVPVLEALAGEERDADRLGRVGRRERLEAPHAARRRAGRER